MEMTLSEKFCPNLKCTKRNWGGDLHPAEKEMSWIDKIDSLCVCEREIYIRDTREHFYYIPHQTNTHKGPRQICSPLPCFFLVLGRREDRHQVTQTGRSSTIIAAALEQNATASYSRILSILKISIFSTILPLIEPGCIFGWEFAPSCMLVDTIHWFVHLSLWVGWGELKRRRWWWWWWNLCEKNVFWGWRKNRYRWGRLV